MANTVLKRYYKEADKRIIHISTIRRKGLHLTRNRDLLATESHGFDWIPLDELGRQKQ